MESQSNSIDSLAALPADRIKFLFPSPVDQTTLSTPFDADQTRADDLEIQLAIAGLSDADINQRISDGIDAGKLDGLLRGMADDTIERRCAEDAAGEMMAVRDWE